MTVQRIGVLGGTFDPVHNGHLQAALAAQRFLELDRLLFIPAGDPWQKHTVATAAQRAEMLGLAIQGHPGFELDRTEIERSGPTYTVDTLQSLRERFARDDLFFILGSDALAGIGSWKESSRLFELAKFAVLERPGHAIDLSVAPTGAVLVVPEAMPETSSTECREMIAAGSLSEAPIPESVIEYIRDNQLYRSAA